MPRKLRVIEKSPRSDILSGDEFSTFAAKISKYASPEPSQEFPGFVKVGIEDLYQPLCSSRIVCPSSIRSKVRGILHGGLANAAIRDKRLQKLVHLVEGDVTPVIGEQYLEEFCRKLAQAVTIFMIGIMREAKDDQHILACKQKSQDNFDQLFFQQTLYNVVGYSVKAVLERCRRNKTSQRYLDIQRLVLDKFARIGTMEARPEEPSFWTALLARKAYTFVSEPVFNFFVEVAKVLCYVETETGSIPKKEVVKMVSTSPSLVAQWGTIVGVSLVDNDSFFLMRLLVLSLCCSFGRGILLRRMNAEAEKKRQGVTSVGLRSQLT